MKKATTSIVAKTSLSRQALDHLTAVALQTQERINALATEARKLPCPKPQQRYGQKQ